MEVRFEHIYKAIRELHPYFLVEIGVGKGDRALAMILAALQHREEIRYRGYDFFETAQPTKLVDELTVLQPIHHRRMLEALKEIPNAYGDLIIGDTNETLDAPEFWADSEQADVVFIDGGHSLATIENDFRSILKHTRQGGVILLDDYYTDTLEDFTDKWGRNHLVKKLRQEEFDVRVMPGADGPYAGLNGGSVQIAQVRVP